MNSVQNEVGLDASSSLATTSRYVITKDESQQNTLNRQRSNNKGKYLTRSHAMRESTSPPRTPTPRSANLTPSPSNLSSESKSESRISSSSPIPVLQSSLSVPQQSNLFATNSNISVSQLDLEFPKLTPPKSKSPRNSNNNTITINNNNNSNSNNRDSDRPAVAATVTTIASDNCNNYSNSNTNIVVNSQRVADAKATNQQNTSSNRNNSTTNISSSPSSMANATQVTVTNDDLDTDPADSLMEREARSPCDRYSPIHTELNDRDGCHGGISDANAPRNRNNSHNKGSRSRSKHLNSNDGNINFGSRSRDSSAEHEHYTDSNGVDLLQFFKITLNKNSKDRYMLLRIEKELTALAQDQTRNVMKFPTMSSYNRMLIHRVAAWFGMEHNVDGTLQCVIVATAKSTRLPEIKFKTLLTDTFTDEPSKKSILKRDAHSFDEYRHSLLGNNERGGMADRKAKSFEQREQEYERAKRRIFKDVNTESMEQFWHNWSGSVGSDQSKHKGQSNRLLKVQSSENRSDGRPSVSKSHSFGGYGPQSQNRLSRGDSVNSTKSAGPLLLTKQDSAGSAAWRLSPSSSGYKTQSQSVRSESITPSPSYGSVSGDNTPEPAPASGVVWAVTDMASVPKGSVLIDPQTLQPIVNQDGSMYHFDPTNLPPNYKLPPAIQSNEQLQGTRKKVRTVQTDIKDRDGTETNNEEIIKPDIEISSIPSDDLKCDTELALIEQSNNATNTVLCSISQLKISLKESETNENDIEENRVEDENDQSDETGTHLSHSPPVKNQATSPNIPEIANIEVETTGTDYAKDNNKKDNDNPSELAAPEASKTQRPQPYTTNTIDLVKKDDIKIMSAVVPVLSYAAPATFPPIEESVPIYSGGQPQPAAYPTTYQQGVDGSVYAVPNTVMYGYQTTEGEYPSIFVPIYEQDDAKFGGRNLRQPGLASYYDQSNAAGAIMPSAAQQANAIYQPPGTVVMPTFIPCQTRSNQAGIGSNQAGIGAEVNPAYPQYAGNHQALYPGQIVYAPEQFSAQAHGAAGQQIPFNYPAISYSYPCNGSPYWSQAMTYYVPQTIPAGSAVLSPPPGSATPVNNGQLAAQPQTPTARIQSTPPHLQSATAPNAPPNGYIATFIQSPTNETKSAIFAMPPGSNVFQYPTPPIQLAPHNATAQNVPTVHSVSNTTYVTTPSSSHAESTVVTSSYNNHKPISHRPTTHLGGHKNLHTTGGPNTIQSVPISTHQSNKNNQTIYRTPNIISNGIPPHMNVMANNGSHEVTYTNSPHPNANNFGKKIQLGSNRKVPNGPARPNTYNYQQQYQAPPPTQQSQSQLQQSHISTPKIVATSQTSNSCTNYGEPNSVISSDKRSVINNAPHTNISANKNKTPASTISNHSGAVTISTGPEKPRGPRPKLPALDFRRNVNSNRNTPSTNSTESNNSPNSIISLEHQPLYMSRAPHIQTAITNSLDGCQSLACNPATGMYVKLGQAYFSHSMAFPNKTAPNDMRHHAMQPLSGIYPTMNMMLTGYASSARPLAPRTSHMSSNYKGHRPPR